MHVQLSQLHLVCVNVHPSNGTKIRFSAMITSYSFIKTSSCRQIESSLVEVSLGRVGFSSMVHMICLAHAVSVIIFSLPLSLSLSSLSSLELAMRALFYILFWTVPETNSSIGVSTWVLTDVLGFGRRCGIPECICIPIISCLELHYCEAVVLYSSPIYDLRWKFWSRSNLEHSDGLDCGGVVFLSAEYSTSIRAGGNEESNSPKQSYRTRHCSRDKCSWNVSATRIISQKLMALTHGHVSISTHAVDQ